MENNNKILIDKALLESINQTLKNVREYLEQNDEALPELITNAYKGLTKALNYFNNVNPELHCGIDEVETNIGPDFSKADIVNILGGYIWVENSDTRDILFESDQLNSVAKIKRLLTLMADPENYYMDTLNPKYFSDYNFVEIFEDWKNDYVLPSEFEGIIDLSIDDQRIGLSKQPIEASAQRIVYPRY